MANAFQITRAQAVALYSGSQAALARALGCSRQQIHRLGADQALPRWMAYRLRYELKPEVFEGSADLLGLTTSNDKAA